MDEELLKEINKIILECFNDPPIALYKGIDPLTRKAVNTSISFNLLYESQPHQYKLSDSGMRVILLGSIEKYLSELESKNKVQPPHIVNHGNFVAGDNSGILSQSSDTFKNNKTNINQPSQENKVKPFISILLKFWWLFLIPIIVGILLLLIENNFFK